MESDGATLTLRVPAALKEQLEQLARATDRSRSWLAVEALQAYLDANQWQVAEIQAGIREADDGELASEAEVDEVFGRWTRR